MWSKIRRTLSRYQLIIAAIFMLCAPLSVFSQAREAQKSEPKNNTQPQIQAKTVMVVPIVPQGAPRYTGLLMTKLVEQNFARTEVLSPSVLAQDIAATTRVSELAEELDPQERISRLIELGEQRGVRYVAAGAISKEGSNYQFKMLIVDVQKERSVLSSEKTAVGLENVDRLVMALTDELISKEFPKAVQERVQKISAAEVDEDEELREDLADLEQIAEEDPEEAIRRLPEKVQKAVAEKAKEQAKDEAREEVVQEEIQNLYDKEKEEQRIARARKIQKYSLFGLYGLRVMADAFDAVSVQSRIQEAQYWSAYMAEPYGFYDQYTRFNEKVRGQTGASFIIGGLASSGLGGAHWLYYPDILRISKTGRSILAVSQAMYTLGAMGTLTAGIFGIDSMVEFHEYYTLEYSTAGQNGMDDAYEEYRDQHEIYKWTQWGAYSFQAAGLLGTATALMWPGERQPLYLSRRGQNLVSIGNLLYGAASFARNVGLNYALRETEERISADTRGLSYENTAVSQYETIALSSSITALTLYAASAVSTVWGLFDTSSVGQPQTESKSFFWGFIPYKSNGVSLNFNLYVR